MAYSKMGRNSSQRKALIRDLITDLIINGRIETTLCKAKELQRLADKMVTLGKKGDLAAVRQAAKLIRFELATEVNEVLITIPLSVVIKISSSPFTAFIDASIPTFSVVFIVVTPLLPL